MKFDVYCTRPITDENGNATGVIKHKLVYDNVTSELFDYDVPVEINIQDKELQQDPAIIYTNELSEDNISRFSIVEFYKKKHGDEHFIIKENDWYDKINMKDRYDHWAFRQHSVRELRSGMLLDNYEIVNTRLKEWIESSKVKMELSGLDEKCLNCPVLQACKGKHTSTCDVAFSDHIAFFALFIEVVTGWLPYKIIAHDYVLPSDRSNLWGFE